MSEEDFPVLLAKRTIEDYLRSGKVISPPSRIPEVFKRRQGPLSLCIKREDSGDVLALIFPLRIIWPTRL